MKQGEKMIIKYQLVNEEGDYILEPYYCERSAYFMVKNHFPNATVIEIEEFVEDVNYEHN